MKTLIVGGSGFVGTRLIDDLVSLNKSLNQNKSNFSIINFDKRRSVKHNHLTTNCDIRKINQISIPKDTDTVVLLAAEHRDDVKPTSLYYDVNVGGTENVLKSMDISGVKNLIFTSSVAVYGLNKKNPDEEHSLDPFNDYGKSKRDAEILIKQWYLKDTKNKSVTIIRPTVIFGENNKGNVYTLMKKIADGNFVMIGNGKNKKSMAYLGNIVSFIIDRIKIQQNGYEIYNYSDTPDLSMLQLVDIIQSQTGVKIEKIRIPFLIGLMIGYVFDFFAFITRRKFDISSVRIKKFCATTQFNSRKAHLKFEKPYSLKEALFKTIEYEFRQKIK